MAKKTQKDRIRRHLLKGRSITPMLAIIMFRCTRLSAVIYDLRHEEGIPIQMMQPFAPVRPFAVYSVDKKWLREWKRRKHI